MGPMFSGIHHSKLSEPLLPWPYQRHQYPPSQLSFRPRTECDLRAAMKLIATGTASRLDCHSAHDSHHVMGQFGWVSVFRKIAFALCSLKAATQYNFRRRSPRSHFFPSGRTSTRQALNHEASRWNQGWNPVRALGCNSERSHEGRIKE
jgi:hypothetical protein